MVQNLPKTKSTIENVHQLKITNEWPTNYMAKVFEENKPNKKLLCYLIGRFMIGNFYLLSFRRRLLLLFAKLHGMQHTIIYVHSIQSVGQTI